MRAHLCSRICGAQPYQIRVSVRRNRLGDGKRCVLTYIRIGIAEHDGGGDLRAFEAAQVSEPEYRVFAILIARIEASDIDQCIVRDVAAMYSEGGQRIVSNSTVCVGIDLTLLRQSSKPARAVIG